jgi:hypothetical protein
MTGAAWLWDVVLVGCCAVGLFGLGVWHLRGGEVADAKGADVTAAEVISVSLKIRDTLHPHTVDRVADRWCHCKTCGIAWIVNGLTCTDGCPNEVIWERPWRA